VGWTVPPVCTERPSVRALCGSGASPLPRSTTRPGSITEISECDTARTLRALGCWWLGGHWGRGDVLTNGNWLPQLTVQPSVWGEA